MADLTNQEITELLENHTFTGAVAERTTPSGHVVPGYTWEERGWHYWEDHYIKGEFEIVEGLGKVSLVRDFYESGDYSGEMQKVFHITFEDGTEAHYALDGTWRSYDGSEWDGPVTKVDLKEVAHMEWVPVP